MDDYDFTLGVTTGSSNRKECTIYVNGKIAEHSDIEGSDSVEDGYKVTNYVVGSGLDVWEVRGWVDSITCDDDVTFQINGSSCTKQDVIDYRPDRFDNRGPRNHNHVEGSSALQDALDSAHEESGDAGSHERRSLFRPGPNAELKPGHTVHVHRNQTLDLNGCTRVMRESIDAFTLDYGARIVNGMVDLRSVGSGKEYDAAVFNFDPMNMSVGGDRGDRNAAYVNHDAWVPHDGEPDNEYRTGEVQRQNLSGTGVAVRDVEVLGLPRDDSTLFRFHRGASPDGWMCSSIDMLEVEANAIDVAYPVVIDSIANNGYINDLEIRGHYSGWRVGVSILSEAIARKNLVRADFQPADGISEHHIVIDNPRAEDNSFEGCMWDTQRTSSNNVVRCDRASGMNRVLDKTSAHDNGYREGDAADRVNLIGPRGL